MNDEEEVNERRSSNSKHIKFTGNNNSNSNNVLGHRGSLGSMQTIQTDDGDDNDQQQKNQMNNNSNASGMIITLNDAAMETTDTDVIEIPRKDSKANGHIKTHLTMLERMRNAVKEFFDITASKLGSKVHKEQTRIFIVRHAELVAPNATALSSYGSLQAASIADIFDNEGEISAIISSSLCKQTAEVISQAVGVDVTIDDRLRRWDRGIVDGLSLEEVKRNLPDIYQKRYVERIPTFKVPEGESLQDRHDRVKGVLDDVVKNFRGKQVILVTHGGVIDDVYRVICGLELSKLPGISKKYGSVSVIVHDKNHGWHREKWAVDDHLPQAVAESPTGGHLYLFPHQVAGSVPFLRGDRGELCKPANKNELSVYELMKNSPLKRLFKFTPIYIGTVDIDVKHILNDIERLNVPLREVGEGNRTLTRAKSEAKITIVDTTQNEQANPKESAVSAAQTVSTPRNHQRDSVSRENEQPTIHLTPEENVPDGKEPFSITNLWKRFAEGRWKKGVTNPETGCSVFMILGNLSHGLRRPFVLDLKMGVQQHGPDENEDKIARKLERVNATTSAKLGVRIGGMKIYNKQTHQYILKDKYWGRNQSTEGFKDAMRIFVSEQIFHELDQTDMHRTRVRELVTEKILDQLRSLAEAIKECNWRFYGSSLLIIYESDPIPEKSSIVASTSGTTQSSVPLVSEVKPIMKSSSAPDVLKTRRPSFSSLLQHDEDPDRVKVKLIDFSHCVATEHDTYDEGLLTGVNTLIEVFTEVSVFYLIDLDTKCKNNNKHLSCIELYD